jgi:uncharacterized protein
VLSSDRIRKELAGLPAEARTPAPYGNGIYTTEWTERTYAELLRRASVLLAHGESVIADASFISARQRAAAAATAAGVRPGVAASHRLSAGLAWRRRMFLACIGTMARAASSPVPGAIEARYSRRG